MTDPSSHRAKPQHMPGVLRRRSSLVPWMNIGHSEVSITAPIPKAFPERAALLISERLTRYLWASLRPVPWPRTQCCGNAERSNINEHLFTLSSDREHLL